jgi:N-acetylglutamate synthase-like GNAT family acetyltransferase
MHVRVATAVDLPWVVETARVVLGDPYQAHSRRQFHVTDAEVLVAERAGEPVGFASWEVDADWCEVLAIGCTERRSGAGSALMAAVADAATARGCHRIRVVTTDENTGAQRFYEQLGYELAERIVGGVDECRRLYKPTIPGGIHDELRYERDL